MNRIKELFNRYREVILYLFFGVATTIVGWIVYFSVLWGYKAVFSVPAGDTVSSRYLIGYTAAQILQWIIAVLFAFFSNRAWVFTKADKDVPVMKQLIPFAVGRVATLGVDYVVTYFGGFALAALFPSLTAVALFGRAWNFAEIGAKVFAAILVIVGNFFISKFFVFTKKKSSSEESPEA